MRWHFVPAGHIGIERSDPSTRDVIGKKVASHICPTNGVVFCDTRPGDTIEFTRLHGNLDIFIRQRHWNHAKLLEESTGGGKGEYLLAFEILETVDGLLGGKVTRVP